MSHFLSRLGDLLHLHCHAFPLVVGEPARSYDEPVPLDVDARSHSFTTDQLSFLGLTVEHHASPPDIQLGKFALLSGDDPTRARVDSIWTTLD